MKVIGIIFGALIALPIVFIAFYALHVLYSNWIVYPAYLERANSSNDRLFESGVADVVVVAHSVEAGGRIFGARTRHVCAERAAALPYGIKGGPFYWQEVTTTKGQPAEIELSRKATYKADLGIRVCYTLRRLKRNGDALIGAPLAQVETGAVLIVKSDGKQKCDFPLWKGGSAYGGFRVDEPVFVSVEQVPIREVFDRSDLPGMRHNGTPSVWDPSISEWYVVRKQLGCISEFFERGTECVSPETLDPFACTATAAGLAE